MGRYGHSSDAAQHGIEPSLERAVEMRIWLRCTRKSQMRMTRAQWESSRKKEKVNIVFPNI